jgi:hypothetical protein
MRNELIKQIENLKKQLEVIVRQELEDAITSFVRKHASIVHAVTWTQYTPWFNDGEACEFSLGEVYLRFVGAEDDDNYLPDQSEIDWLIQRGEDPKKIESKQALANNIELHSDFDSILSYLNNTPEYLLNDLFGDHVQVIVNKDGIKTESYEHD